MPGGTARLRGQRRHHQAVGQRERAKLERLEQFEDLAHVQLFPG